MDAYQKLTDQAFRLGTTSNGLALTLSIAAYADLFGAAVEVSKFPIWCFFIGVAAGGFVIFLRIVEILHSGYGDHLSNVASLTETSSDLLSEIRSTKTSLEELRVAAAKTGSMISVQDDLDRFSALEAKANQQLSKLDQMKETINGTGSGFVSLLAGSAAYSLLSFQFILFILGAFIGINGM